jgi:hypothetical protein
MNMSFMLTREQILNQTKACTRRLGWRKLKQGDILQPVYKCQGLKKGEKVEKLGCKIIVIQAKREPLAEILHSYWDHDSRQYYQCIWEGFPKLNPQQFISMFCKANKCLPETEITKIFFNYLEPL